MKAAAAIYRLSEDAIEGLVDDFYVKIHAGVEPGPIFAHAIPGDWGPHLATMRNFGSSVMLTSGRYKGDPVAVHGQVAGTEVELFERWLPPFDETCRELFVPDIADLFASKAVNGGAKAGQWREAVNRRRTLPLELTATIPCCN